jgi:hypothetical protein
MIVTTGGRAGLGDALDRVAHVLGDELRRVSASITSVILCICALLHQQA